jgi:acetyl esterase
MTTPHPRMAEILAAQQAAPPPDPETLPIAEARRNFAAAAAMWNTPLPVMPTEDATVGGLACRLLSPEKVDFGLVVFVHGGGWTFGSPATHERFARLLSNFADAAVLVPDYRLAPEHPAPAAIEDVLAVIADLGPIMPADARLALCGDSAGATIALAAALAKPARPVAMLSLLYGCYAPDFETDSHLRNGDGRFGLSTKRMRWYWGNWLGAAHDARAAPLHGDFAGLPTCHLLAAGLDPLCDDTLLLARRLAAAGVPIRLDVVPGVAHGFLQMSAQLPPALAATKAIGAEIAASLRPDDKQKQQGNAP